MGQRAERLIQLDENSDRSGKITLAAPVKIFGLTELEYIFRHVRSQSFDTGGIPGWKGGPKQRETKKPVRGKEKKGEGTKRSDVCKEGVQVRGPIICVDHSK